MSQLCLCNEGTCFVGVSKLKLITSHGVADVTPAAATSSVGHPSLRNRIMMNLTKLTCTQTMRPAVCRNVNGSVFLFMQYFQGITNSDHTGRYRKIREIYLECREVSPVMLPKHLLLNSVLDHVNIRNAS